MVEIESDRINIDEDWRCADDADRFRRGDKSKRRGDDFVAGTDIQGPQHQMEGVGTIAYADGRKAQWPTVAFSPRKSAFVFYIAWRKHPDLLKKIGKYKTVGGCLHVKTLQDIDEPALQRLITAAHRTWAD